MPLFFGWQGAWTGCIESRQTGTSVCDDSCAYIVSLIRYQGPQWFEPVTYFGNNTLKDVYDYEPVQKEWSPAVEKLLMGVQASLWTEFCNKPEDVDYLLFPRLSALAEGAWTQTDRKIGRLI